MRSWQWQGYPEHVDAHRATWIGAPDVALDGGRHALQGEPLAQVGAEEGDQIRHVAAKRGGVMPTGL